MYAIRSYYGVLAVGRRERRVDRAQVVVGEAEREGAGVGGDVLRVARLRDRDDVAAPDQRRERDRVITSYSIHYTKLYDGAIDPFARVLYHFALFLGLLVLTLARVFLKVPFAVSWWAYTFPLDALTIATLEYHERTGAEGLAPVCWTALVLTTAIVVLVFARTLGALVGGKLFVPEG